MIYDKVSVFLSKELVILERGCIKEFDFLSCVFFSENFLLKIKDELKEYGFIFILRDLENFFMFLILDNVFLLDNMFVLDNIFKKLCMIVLESVVFLSVFLEKLEKINVRVFACLVLDKEKKVLVLVFLYED